MSGNNRPDWVTKELSSILGLDSDSIKQLLLPEFEGYTHQTKLRSHLQDFLGPSPPAKAFTDRYVSLRFPSLSNTIDAVPSPSLPSGPLKPSGGSKVASGANTPFGSALAGGVSAPPSSEALSAAFGPGGKIYQKNRDADDTSDWYRRTGGAGSSSAGPGSGSNTPGGGGGGVYPGSASGRGTHTPVVRAGGAITIHEAKARGGKKAEGSGSASAGGGKEGVHGSKIWDLPKSKEVLRLEGVMKDLRDVQAGEGKVKVDPSTACFCQARNHALSTYTPHCPHCGLILCSLHPPYYPCPSCIQPFLSPAALSRLILRVQSDIDAQLASEQADRDEEENEKIAAAKAQAAFPYLAGAGGAGKTTSVPVPFQDQGTKVLRIEGKGKGKSATSKGKGKAILTTTYTRPSPSGTSTPLETEEVPTDVLPRPRSAPMDPARVEREMKKLVQWREEEDRPWGDVKAAKKGEQGLQHIPPVVVVMNPEDHVGRRKAKKAKGVGMDGRAVVGAATS